MNKKNVVNCNPETPENYITQYYRCPSKYAAFHTDGILTGEHGFFAFGDSVICFGQLTREKPSPLPNKNLPDVAAFSSAINGITHLPFDITQVVNNLRMEDYASCCTQNTSLLNSIATTIYYIFRPLLPVKVRKHLQKARLSDWKSLTFPRWPVDRSIDLLFEELLLQSLRACGVKRIPFIWFWPHGASSCAIMTHDVETQEGRDFCKTLMEINDSYAIKSSFNIVPERRYQITEEFLRSLKDRGFEVNVHDLNHDGHLFRERGAFLERAKKINAYGARFGSAGFRSAVLYRNQHWLEALNFSYDMSVPNVGHLEAQRGGCCTVMPYFLGDMLELPLTTTQDYALFNYLDSYSLDLWKLQITLIMRQHGLISFLVHPDYVTKTREQEVYRSLLSYLANLRVTQGLWIPTPGQVNQWWRRRAKMRLVEDGDRTWIEGEGCEQARIAYASEINGQIAYSFE